MTEAEPIRFTGYVPKALLIRDNEVWTDEAVQSLIGQEPRLNYGGDWTTPQRIGRCRVVDARQDDDGIHITIDVLREHREGAVEEALRELSPDVREFSLGPGSHPIGIGYTVPEQRWTNGTAEDSVRQIVKANLREAHPMAWPPAEPKETTDEG